MINNVFGNIIEITLSASIVIALLLILSKLLDKNYTAKWRYWVWLVIALRLIIPFNITMPNPPILLSAPDVTTPMSVISDIQNAPTLDEVNTVIEQADENIILSKVEASCNRTLTTNNFDVVKILMVLWITGMVIFIMYHLTIYFLFCKKIKPWCADVKDAEILRIYKNVCNRVKVIKRIPIMICKTIESPMVIGFRRQILLLPDMTFSPQHLEMILWHELIHVKRKDVLYKTLILLARAVHWFNPFVHLMAMEANRDVELSCDAAVVGNQNVDYRKDYSKAILSVIHKGSTSNAVFSTYFGGGKKVLKKRFASLFDMRRKRKGVISMLVVVLLLGFMGLCISCTQNANLKAKDGIIYENKTLGFSLAFPKDWKDKYIIEELDNNVYVFNRKVYEKYKGAGLLFTVGRITGELITEEDMEQQPVRQQIVLQGNGYTYFTRMPSDMQYPPDDEELSSDYKAMAEEAVNISRGMSLLGKQKPKAVNEGFKLVGSSFFTVEIPRDWELKASEGSLPNWSIYSKKNRVGEIALIPYKGDELGEGNAADDSIMIEYLANDETYSKVRITLNSKDANQGTMDKIKNSFAFTGGPYNVVDLQYAAEQYIGGGGKKVFGKIEELMMENGNPKAVRIKAMKLIEGSNASGFRIEDLRQTETYPLDFGVNIAPLVAPNYNTYGIYEMPMLDETFIKNYKNYKDFFYDFIIGSDGQLKIILGHYVP